MHPYQSRVLSLAALLLVVACNGTGPNASQALHVSFTSRSITTPRAPVSAAIQIGSGANSLTINQAQMVLAEIELSPSGSCATTDDDTMAASDGMEGGGGDMEEADDCDELQAGPMLVDLPVDGTTKVILDAAVPAGTYRSLHAKVDAVGQDDHEQGASAFLMAHPELKGISVKVTGVFTDANNQAHSFTFTLEADAEIEAAFNPPVTVGPSTSNLTVAVDVASWFKDSTGAAIDPTNPANASLIEHNIRQSFRSFEDDNHDGMDDQGEDMDDQGEDMGTSSH
jgi:hypothetical protein